MPLEIHTHTHGVKLLSVYVDFLHHWSCASRSLTLVLVDVAGVDVASDPAACHHR